MTEAEKPAYDGLRSFLARAEEFGEIETIRDADWNLEIGALSETTAETDQRAAGAALRRDQGLSQGLSGAQHSDRLAPPHGARARPAARYAEDGDRQIRRALKRMQNSRPRSAARRRDRSGDAEQDERQRSRYFQISGALESHRLDGGRYIGTGDSVINQRSGDRAMSMSAPIGMQAHEAQSARPLDEPRPAGAHDRRALLEGGQGLPGRRGLRRRSLVFFLSYTKFPSASPSSTRRRLARPSARRDQGTVRPACRSRRMPRSRSKANCRRPASRRTTKGRSANGTGYYSGGTAGTGDAQPVIRVKAIYYRDDPILLNMAPQWPGAPHHSVRFEAGGLVGAARGRGRAGHSWASMSIFRCLSSSSIKQHYAGHARQAGKAVLGANSSAGCRYRRGRRRRYRSYESGRGPVGDVDALAPATTSRSPTARAPTRSTRGCRRHRRHPAIGPARAR